MLLVSSSEQSQSGGTGVVALQAADVKTIAEALNVHVHAVLKLDTVHAEALKLPSFWFTCPAIWFAQVEAQFITRQHPIEANLTKYNYVVAALDTVATGEVHVEALISSPSVVNKYMYMYPCLKQALIRAFGKIHCTSSERQ